MLAFYFSNKKDKENRFDVVQKYCSQNSEFDFSSGRITFFAHDSFKPLERTNDNFISNVGIFVYKNEMNNSALNLFMEDLKQGADLKDILKDTSGHFGLVLFYEGKLHFITDKAGLYPLYAYQKDGIVEVSSLLNEISRNNTLTIDYAGLMNHMIRGGDTFLLRTCFNEIELMEEGTIYTYEEGALKKEKYYNLFQDIVIDRYKKFDELVEKADELFQKNLAFLKNQKDIVLDLSGGFDTRTILSFLLKENYDFFASSCIVRGIYHVQIGSGFYEEADQDIVISEKIADTFGFKHGFKYLDRENSIPLEEEFEFVRDMNPLCSIERAHTYTHVLNYHRTKGLNGNVSLSGLGGTETLNKRGVPKTEVEKGFRANKYYHYKPILKDGLLSEEDFYKTLQNDFDSHLENVEYERGYDLEIFASLHKKFKRGGVSLAHFNYFIPTYSPYLEANFIRFLSECKYNHKLGLRIQRSLIPRNNVKLSNMESTHGYPPTRINAGNFYRFPKFYKEHPYELPVLGKLIAYKNFKNAVKMRDSFMVKDWTKYVDSEFEKPMEIFQIVDKEKLNKYMETILDYEKYTLKAQLITLNKYFQEAGVRF